LVACLHGLAKHHGQVSLKARRRVGIDNDLPRKWWEDLVLVRKSPSRIQLSAKGSTASSRPLSQPPFTTPDWSCVSTELVVVCPSAFTLIHLIMVMAIVPGASGAASWATALEDIPRESPAHEVNANQPTRKNRARIKRARTDRLWDWCDSAIRGFTVFSPCVIGAGAPFLYWHLFYSLHIVVPRQVPPHVKQMPSVCLKSYNIT